MTPIEIFAERLHNLGLVAHQSAQFGRASELIGMAVAIDPQGALACSNLAAVLMDRGQREYAARLLRRALGIDDRLPDGWYNLGNLEKAEKAIDFYAKALALKPDFGLAAFNLAGNLKNLGRARGTISWFERAWRLLPDFPKAVFGMASAMRDQGRFKQAIAAYEHAIEIGADPGPCFLGLSSCKRFSRSDDVVIAHMKRILAERDLPSTDRAQIHFALGKIRDDLGQWEAAMVQFDEANRLERPNRIFDAQELNDYGDRMVAAFPSGRAVEHSRASQSELPVFIVGMPRSGTTLVEQILASHSQVSAGGELHFWLDKALPLKQRVLERLGAADRAALADQYLARLKDISQARSRVTDKMPYNFLFLGPIARLFPKARIIHCRRNAIDTALSIYFTFFAEMNEFAYDRRDIVTYFEAYRKLMRHWRRILPGTQMIEIDYETLISNPEAASRKLVDFCGLDWDEGCLQFQTTTRSINTASAWQVRQTIYRSSIDRWRAYEPWLGELRKLAS